MTLKTEIDIMTNEKSKIIFFNGKVVTLDSSDTIASAVAVKDGRILAVGSDEQVKQFANPGAHLIDLSGKTMLPGLIDAHTHLAWAALVFHTFVDGRCPPNKSVSDILERIRQRVIETDKGEWISVQGSFFANFKLDEKRLPRKEDLDSVAPEHPVAYVNTVHSHVVNSAALKSLNITKRTPNPPGAMIERDEKTGEPTGYLRECSNILPIMSFTDEQIKKAIRDIVPQYWVKQGCTTAYSFADEREFRIYQELAKEGSLPLRIQAMPMDVALGSDPVIEGLITLGIQQGFGNEWLKIGGVKIFLDGAFMGLGAATWEPYLNMPVRDY